MTTVALVRRVWHPALALFLSASTAVLLFPFFTYVPLHGRMDGLLPQVMRPSPVPAYPCTDTKPHSTLPQSITRTQMQTGPNPKPRATPLFVAHRPCQTGHAEGAIVTPMHDCVRQHLYLGTWEMEPQVALCCGGLQRAGSRTRRQAVSCSTHHVQGRPA